MTHSLFSRLAKDRAGNFGIMTAIMLPVLMGVAGIAIDLTRVMEEKNQLQALADSATLGAASAMADKGTMSEAEAEAMGTNMVVAQKMQDVGDLPLEEQATMKAELKEYTKTEATASIASNTAANYTVTMKTGYNVKLSGLTAMLGFTSVRINVSSTSQAGREGNALSMYLALDESGSMAWDTTTVDPVTPTKQVRKSREVTKTREETYDCGTRRKPKTCTRTVEYQDTEYYYDTVTNYVIKMASLKAAAAVMFAELKKADPNSELIRVGADSYDDKTKTEQAIAWGTTNVATYVSNLPTIPDGGTDATGALTNAYNALKTANAAEKNAHDAKKNTSFERFIVFMTDGEMTGNSASWNKSLDDKVRTECKTAKDDGIKIYTIAFMAPDNGKSLLEYCSSGDDYYYEPNNMTTLVESFGEIARKAAKTGTRLTN